MSLLRSFEHAIRTIAPITQRQSPKHLTILGVSTTLTLSHFYSTSSPLYAESNSKSSSVLREASPAAYRRPPTQIVFLSKFEERRDE
jgi:hypothetical protein